MALLQYRVALLQYELALLQYKVALIQYRVALLQYCVALLHFIVNISDRSRRLVSILLSVLYRRLEAHSTFVSTSVDTYVSTSSAT